MTGEPKKQLAENINVLKRSNRVIWGTDGVPRCINSYPNGALIVLVTSDLCVYRIFYQYFALECNFPLEV